MTNSEKIRRMSDIDLSDFLLLSVCTAFLPNIEKKSDTDIFSDICLPLPCNICAYEEGSRLCEVHRCVEGIHEWLSKEAQA